MYDENPDEKNALKHVTLPVPGHIGYITKSELQEHQNKLRMQKEEYERRNKVFLSDEIKKAWRN